MNSFLRTFSSKGLIFSVRTGRPVINWMANRSNSFLVSLADTVMTKAIESRNPEKELQELCNSYYDSNKETKDQFLYYIADRLSVKSSQSMNAVNSFLSNKVIEDSEDYVMSVDKLRQQLRPKYYLLMSEISRLENGVKFIVDLRSDLRTTMTDPIHDNLMKVKLRSLNNYLKDLLSLWFAVGFLHLERITWNSPTSILQRISEYEAVHPMQSWADIKRRVGLYRRCFVFSHSCLPCEPIVILHVALMPSISSSIQTIIQKTTPISPDHYDNLKSLPKDQFGAKEDVSGIDAAIFYSITSSLKGLHGIELGNQLIKRVVRELRSEFPLISQFSTLSPIPNFTEYLLSEIQSIQNGDQLKLKNFVSTDELNQLSEHLSPNSDIWSQLMRLIKTNKWIEDNKLVDILYKPLMRKCAHYLCNEKRRGYALNSVAHFHSRNGAVIWRINWLADLTPRGLSNSCGIMVNYRYFIENVENNSYQYTENRIINADKQVRNWIPESLNVNSKL